jgi:prepilin-type N-terminal cleavage/methylation domain-containing protein
MRCSRAGFTLIELMIVLAIIAIIATVAIPGLLRARVTSCEVSAIGCLRSIGTCQTEFCNAAIVDQDTDGAGEYGYLSEMSGVNFYRMDPRFSPGVSTNKVNPTFITSVLGSTALASPLGIANKSGYNHCVYLPTAAGPAFAEPGGGAPVPGNTADANVQEARYAVYAWPAAIRNSGNRAFMINQMGVVFGTENTGVQNYNADLVIPPPGAAFDPGMSLDPANLDGEIRCGIPANDGGVWVAVGS